MKALAIIYDVTEAIDPKRVLRQAAFRRAQENPWGPAWKRQEDGSWKAQPVSNRTYHISRDPQGFRLTELWRGAMTGKWKTVYDRHFSTEQEVKDHFPLRLREAIDPKRVLRQMRGPRHEQPKQVKIIGRRWFRRGYGGTYHVADIYVDGQLVHTTSRQYGYGDQYQETAWQWLEHEGYIPKREHSANGGMACPWRHAEELGIEFLYNVYDVKRQRDL